MTSTTKFVATFYRDIEVNDKRQKKVKSRKKVLETYSTSLKSIINGSWIGLVRRHNKSLYHSHFTHTILKIENINQK